MLVTIAGLPGSGTSTVARAVAARLGVERVDGGTVWRSMAAERGESVAAFSAMSERDPSFDLELDTRLATRARAGDVVLEARLSGWIARNEGLAATTVWIACAPSERARRVAARDGLPLVAALAANEAREASEHARYQAYYGIDLDDLSIYDVQLDSTATPPDVLVAAILDAVA